MRQARQMIISPLPPSDPRMGLGHVGQAGLGQDLALCLPCPPGFLPACFPDMCCCQACHWEWLAGSTCHLLSGGRGERKQVLSKAHCLMLRDRTFSHLGVGLCTCHCTAFNTCPFRQASGPCQGGNMPVSSSLSFAHTHASFPLQPSLYGFERRGCTHTPPATTT